MGKVINFDIGDTFIADLTDSGRFSQPISLDVTDDDLSGPEMVNHFGFEIVPGDILIGLFRKAFSLGSLVIIQMDDGTLFPRFFVESQPGVYALCAPNRKKKYLIPFHEPIMTVRAVVEVVRKRGGQTIKLDNCRLEIR